MDLVKVTVGRKDFLFGGSEDGSFVDAQIKADAFRRDVVSRIRFEEDGEFVYPDDVRFYVRVNDDGQFPEFKTWQLGEYAATKRVSRSMDNKGKAIGGYYIGFLEPWVRYNKETGNNEVMYDSVQLEVDADGKGELAELGFDEANVWIPVERTKMKTKANSKSHYVYKPL